ncbi:hypothetical protein V866_008038 [Kwoniella sp. B9012]
MGFLRKFAHEAKDTFDRMTNDHFVGDKSSRPTTQTMAPPPGTIVDYSRQAYDASFAYGQTAGSYGGYSAGAQGSWGGQNPPDGGYYHQGYGAYGGPQYGYQPSNGYLPQPLQGGQPYCPPPSQNATHLPSSPSPYPPPSPSYEQSTQNSAMCGSPAPSATLGVPSASPTSGRRSLSAAFAASENNANSGVDTSSSYCAGGAAPSPVNFTGGTSYDTWGQPPTTNHATFGNDVSSGHPGSVFGGASTAANSSQAHTDATAARRKSTDSIASEDRSTPGGWVTTDESV